MVSQRENQPIVIMYSLEKHALIYEEDCFFTKEEAQKECDKRNGNKN